jgi:hypothetical protein
MKPEVIIPGLLKKHPLVKKVSLTGSRAGNRATEWSDWDFLVEVSDFDAFSASLPALFKDLEPLSWLWDPLSRHRIFMMILKGPVKIDIIFDLPPKPAPPWSVNKNSLVNIERHFWDWIFWLAGKKIRSDENLVNNELEKMFGFILTPLGGVKCPATVEEAVKNYRTLMQKQLDIFNIELDCALRDEVISGLGRMGFSV